MSNIVSSRMGDIESCLYNEIILIDGRKLLSKRYYERNYGINQSDPITIVYGITEYFVNGTQVKYWEYNPINQQAKIIS